MRRRLRKAVAVLALIAGLIVPAAQAESPKQSFAKSLCIGMRHAYGGTHNGITVRFKGCRPANRDSANHAQLYWVWYSVVRNHRVALLLAKVDAMATPLEGPYKLTPDEYDHMKVPAISTRPGRLSA